MIHPLEQIYTEVRGCQRCRLAEGRTHAVPGVGPCPAGIMLIGEAPGFHEDQQGEPFVGPAGRLLDTLLIRTGLSRDQVYITNVVKCRPPGNRDPQADEVSACSGFLELQLEQVKPKVIVLLGRHAMERLLPGAGSISRIHGTVVQVRGQTYIPVYHPAAALHNSGLIKSLEGDFEKVGQHLARMRGPDAQPPALAPPQTSSGQAEQMVLL